MEPEVNPFQSPQTVNEPAYTGSRFDRRTAAIPFASGHTRATVTMGLLAAGMCLDVLAIGSTLLQIELINRVVLGGVIDEAAAQSNDTREALIGVGQLVVYISTSIAFLMWFHRSHRNLPALGARGLDYTPGWAVGSFFIPILNLFRPYQIMKEVWRGSDPNPSRVFSHRVQNLLVSPLIGWWWALWIIMGVAGQASFRIALHAKTPQELLAASWVSIVDNVVSLPAALVTILMIRAINANQTARNEFIMTQPQSQPQPQPETTLPSFLM